MGRKCAHAKDLSSYRGQIVAAFVADEEELVFDDRPAPGRIRVENCQRFTHILLVNRTTEQSKRDISEPAYFPPLRRYVSVTAPKPANHMRETLL
jgi:hypothetical protein